MPLANRRSLVQPAARPLVAGYGVAPGIRNPMALMASSTASLRASLRACYAGP